ncbi:MAG TPA: carboxypeptidase-like regulatory domain-containing protein, partial [Gemmatimonadaceae bacterium]|nr:carboxypeptidase-like regulatory domain-containing protein [Gemmatimonadaceae bacterium]
MRTFTKFVTALLSVAIVPAAYAQQPTTVSGQVTASVGGTPLAGAQVSIPTLRVGATTDTEGQYSFTVPASATGEVTLTVRRLGYVSRSVPISLTGAPVRQDFALEVGATALAEVVV